MVVSSVGYYLTSIRVEGIDSKRRCSNGFPLGELQIDRLAKRTGGH